MRYRVPGGICIPLLAAVACMVVSCGDPVDDTTTTPNERPALSVPHDDSQALPEAAAAVGQPNIVWILLDACRAGNLSCYGYERATSPNIDRIAERGVVFERAYAQANQTRFSVPSYMTGRYFPVFATSGGGWREMFRTPPEEEQLLPAILRDNGYDTAVASAHPWISNDESRLWRAFDEGHYRGGEFAGLNKWVFSWLEERGGEPFFLYIHAIDTHFPHYPRAGHDQWIDTKTYRNRHSMGYSVDGKTFTEAEQEVLRGLHDGSIHYADACIGELIEKLASLGLLENTIIIVGADHGDALAEDGVTLGHSDDVTQDEVFHVPLVMAGPGLPRGRRVGSLVENVDVVPTLVQLLQLDTTARTDGRALVSLFSGPKGASVHDYVFAKTRDVSHDFIPNMFVWDTTHKYELNRTNKSEHLWLLSGAGEPEEVTNAPWVVELMRGRVTAGLLPKWEAYAALPQDSPSVFSEMMDDLLGRSEIGPAESVVVENLATASDNRWSLVSNAVISTGWSEDAPPLTLRMAIPNGEYAIEMEMLVGIKADYPASAVSIRLEDEAEPRVIKPDASYLDPNGDTTPWWRFVPIGTYTVTDGFLDAVIDEGDPGFWCNIRGFRFTPKYADAPVLPPEEEAERRKQLEKLGYLGG